MKVLMFILVVLFLGCNTERTSLDVFFNKLDNTLSKGDKEKIKKCENIDCLTLFMLSDAPKQFLDSFKSMLPSLNKLLSDSIKIEKQSTQQRILILAYQKSLSNQEVDLIEIKNALIKYDKLEEDKYLDEHRKEVQAQLEIAKINYNKFNTNDTLNLLYPVKRSGNAKEVYFNNFYYNRSYQDTLFLKCILSKKKSEDITEDSVLDKEYHFWLKVVEAKNNELYLIEKEYTKGNIIFLSLYDYGRIIE
jgi:hypothetical protein